MAPITRKQQQANATVSTQPGNIEKDEEIATNEGIIQAPNPSENRPASHVGSHRASSKTSRKTTSDRELQLARAKVRLAAAELAVLEAEAAIDEDDDCDRGTECSRKYVEREEQKRVRSWLLQNEMARRKTETAIPKTEIAIQKTETALHKTETALHNTEPPAAIKETLDTAKQQTQTIDLTELASAIALAAGSGQSRNITELPPFYGSHQDWLSFKAAYNETKHLSENEKLARLRRSLRGRAREAVEDLLIYSTDSDTIIRSLETRFGRPDVIAYAELERLRGLQRPTDAPRDVCIFASRVSNVVATLRALNKVHYLHSPEAVKAIIDKMTSAMRYRWVDYAIDQSLDEPELLKLSKFLNREADRCGPYSQPESLQPVQTDTSNRRIQKTFNTVNKSVKCFICSAEGHFASQCQKFLDKDVNSRWEMAKKHRLCFACLKYKSSSHRCQRTKCEVDGCPRYHHKLLHFVRNSNRATEKEDRGRSETVQSTWTAKDTYSYLKILPVQVSGPSGVVDTYALLDDGSTVSLIDAQIARKTGLKGPIDPLNIEAFANNQIPAKTSRRVKLSLSGASQSFKITANTIENMKLSAQTVKSSDLERYSHLRDIKQLLEFENATPTVLIGQDNWHLLLATEVRRGRNDQPVASHTPLGWVLHGAQTRTLGRTLNYVNYVNNCDDNMDTELKNYFTLDSITIEPKRPQNDPEEMAYTKLREGVKETGDGHYETPLLWKNENSTMPNNYENTLKRLHSIEKKLDRDPILKGKYNEQMSQLIRKQYAEPAPSTRDENRTWYLPHFAVLNPMKPGKVRIVHDAAAKTQGVSLNDFLMTGPDLLQSLPGVLMRFRQHIVAVTSDICEMFMQVKIAPSDRDALRYLWREDRRDDKPPDEYRMTSLIFGASCSPSTAIFVKNFNALKFEKQYPVATSAIIKNHYVDDYLGSYKTEQEAIEIARQVREIHSHAHYELRQWTSNSLYVIEALEPSSTQSQKIEIDSDSKTERVLGLIWKPATDSLTFNLNMSRLPEGALENTEPTKRDILKIMMSVFDPLGFASPITVNAKAILQQVWRRGTGWDEKIDHDLAVKWQLWIENMKKLHTIAIPRCYLQYSEAKSRQLHVFVDSSETAYAAVLYWRVTSADDSVHLSFITSKAKVAPLKVTSIPRLELQAAVMGSKIATTVIEEHDEKPDKKFFWTDSKTVLTWIQNGARSYKPFVAHRIAAIEENSTVHEWRWVPTKLNVADDATREIPRDLDQNHRWWKGPEFLLQDSSQWPSEKPKLTENTGEERVNHVSMKKREIELKNSVPDWNRFSKWERLVRATATVLKFIYLCRRKRQTIQREERQTVLYNKRTKRNNENDPDWKRHRKATVSPQKKNEIVITTANSRKYLPIESSFLQEAEKLIVRASQEETFYEEIQYKLHNSGSPNRSRLHSISTELNDCGILTLQSRIAAVEDVPENVKRPAVLDGNHRVTKLYIDYVHRQLLHAGVEATINECRQRYWIIRLRPVARMVIHQCLKCRIQKATPTEPATGNLPSCRLAHHQRPFTYTGLDYFGPLVVTVNRTRQKRYVALFTCLTTRAVHLEVANTLNAESAVMALRRMIARRGCPTEIWSDNGTNFHSANKELRAVVDLATKEEASKRYIAWRFITPGAPFMGGAWERMVRSVKTALKTVLNERYPTDEVLTTLLAEVEFTVNSRPLTHVSVDPADPEALTPNHFLLHGSAQTPQSGTFTDNDLIGRTHWRASQRLADMFWGRWLREYLPTLQNRRDPSGHGPQLKIGDVVLVVDNTLPRNTWPMGIVTATYPGSDGIVRVADVRTRGNILRRPTKKLVIIPTSDEGAEPSSSPATAIQPSQADSRRVPV